MSSITKQIQNFAYTTHRETDFNAKILTLFSRLDITLFSIHFIRQEKNGVVVVAILADYDLGDFFLFLKKKIEHTHSSTELVAKSRKKVHLTTICI